MQSSSLNVPGIVRPTPNALLKYVEACLNLLWVSIVDGAIVAPLGCQEQKR